MCTTGSGRRFLVLTPGDGCPKWTWQSTSRCASQTRPWGSAHTARALGSSSKFWYDGPKNLLFSEFCTVGRPCPARNSIAVLDSGVRASIQNQVTMPYTCLGAPDFPRLWAYISDILAGVELSQRRASVETRAYCPPYAGHWVKTHSSPPPCVQYNQMGLLSFFLAYGDERWNGKVLEAFVLTATAHVRKRAWCSSHFWCFHTEHFDSHG